ncbi:MAG: L,D-transpeptidase [Bacteroidetes bacterium]|nr:L,D-transpeptidase [Bacteroidota bacterium]
MMKRKYFILGTLVLGLITSSCVRKYVSIETADAQTIVKPRYDSLAPLFYDIAEEEVVIHDYFSWINQRIERYDSLLPYSLNDGILIHANSWLIDTFAHSDYYYQQARGVMIENQREYTVIKPGDTLRIPSVKEARMIEEKLDQVRIDVNLPEYKLRLWSGDSLICVIPIRIGQNGRKYLATEGREFNLRTIIGKGTIVNILEDPRYVSFSTGKEYIYTRRDDGKTTRMPQIPSFEPEINGVCHGQLIHATTNPNTLGKAYSHGCMGTREEDAWRIYFYVRPGTPIEIRYDLYGVDEAGNPVEFEDVYQLKNKTL